MGLFDWNENRNRHDYGRDYTRGYGGDYRGGGRHESLGDRMRGAWNRFEERLGGGGGMARGYDRDLPRRDSARTWSAGGRGYDSGDFAYRGTEGAWSTARNRGAHDSQWDWRAAGGSRYDQDLGGRARGGGYDRGYGARRGMQSYDRDLPARHRADAGDPFGDRQRRTPFRVLRGGFDTEETDRGGWMDGNQLNQLGGGGRDPYGVNARGWNRGIGDEPMYRPEDFRGRDRGRGR